MLLETPSTAVARSPAALLTIGLVVPPGPRAAELAEALARPGLALLASVADPDELLLAAADAPLRVVVIALDEPSRESCVAVRELGRALPDPSIVAVAPWTNATVRKVLRAGAAGYVLEPRAAQTLAITVEAVCAGQTVVPLDLRHHVEETALSHREKQILAMVVMGFTNSEIASRFFLAESTVKSHLSAAFRKLGVRSRKDAAALILDPDGGVGTGILSITDTAAPAGKEAE